MNTTLSHSQQPEWDSKQFRDISYIKSRLRYPAGIRIFLPAIIGMLVLAIAAVIAFSVVFKQQSPQYTPLFIGAGVCIITWMISSRFYRELQFISIQTGFDSKRNQQLIDSFLKARHMVVFRHPQATEVFQIISKNINPIKEQREILVFIADEQRILINSHFTNSGFSLVPGVRHHRQMAAELQLFLSAPVKK